MNGCAPFYQWTRLEASNRKTSAIQFTGLSYRRGVISAESEPLPIDFELLDTHIWRLFAAQRRFFTGDAPDRLLHIGIAKWVVGKLQPLRAAEMRFAKERPPIPEQVSDWVDGHDAQVNNNLRRNAGLDTCKASKCSGLGWTRASSGGMNPAASPAPCIVNPARIMNPAFTFHYLCRRIMKRKNENNRT